MMRAALLAFALVSASVALAEEPPPPRPDYSQEALLRLFSPPPPRPPLPPKRVQWHLGSVQFQFRALGMDWRAIVIYLPLAAPLPGTRLSDAATVPNPFALTGTQYASTMPPMFQEDRPRGVERELRRIKKLTRKR